LQISGGAKVTAKPTYDPARSSLLFVDPYNDFLSEGGKLWPMVKEFTEQGKARSDCHFSNYLARSFPGISRTLAVR
jgi:hypothetical protein